MKNHAVLTTLLLVGLLGGVTGGRADETLAKNFQNPPPAARPHTWWHWINGNITKAGITADLEAMRRAGIGGVQVFNVDVGIPPGDTPFMSPQWREAFKHAVKEANRLGIELCLHNCAGWSSSGGPWITPPYAMQILTWSEKAVQGPMRFEGVLAQPPTRVNYYRDIAVLAVRKPAGERSGNALRIANTNIKAGFERGDRIAPDATPTPAGMATPLKEVVVLTNRLTPEGKLTWDVPAGEWTLIRLGHTPTGKDNHPSPEAGRGLECDKLSREAMDVHWQGGIKPLLDDLGPLVGKALNNSLIDSYEVGSQNWTPKFREEFQKRRGYDPLPYLPTVTGRVMESIEVSERFLWDFRRTICDLFADNYFGYFGELCRKHGLQFSVEGYGNGSFDNLQVAGLGDIPMGEFWVGGAAAETTKLASSAAHTNGRKVVGAESFTADEGRGRWLVEPYAIKALGDRIFSLGVNRYIFHRYTHQPWLNLKPGMTMGPWGMHLERTLTWWEQSAAWLRYIARCQYLLQSGQFAADILYFTGDDGPNDLPWLRDQLAPLGYDYDGCDATVLHKARVENGQIVLSSGMRYRLLVLPDSAWMTPQTLRKVGELLEAGAKIVGPKPSRSPSLVNYPACDTEVQQLSDAIWGKEPGGAKNGKTYGKGTLYEGLPLTEAPAKMGIEPDVTVVGPKNPLVWIHRATEDAHLYFLANQRYSPFVGEVAFPQMHGRPPELWNPETGAITSAPVWQETPASTRVSLRLGPAESVFVVFRRTSASVAARATESSVQSVSYQGKEKETPKEPRVEIVKAVYEAIDGAGQTDVTAKIAALIAAGETEIPATNALFGDPTVNHLKRLRVTYLLDGKRMEQLIPENELFLLGWRGSDTDLPEFELTTQDNHPTLQAWSAGDYTVVTRFGLNAQIKAKAPESYALRGPWEVAFPPNLGAPAAVTLPNLISWSEHTLPGVRYFSGSATYTKTFDLPEALFSPDRAIFLDLGTVKNFAEVTLNGTRLPLLWKAPFRLAVTGLVKPQGNQLTVRVTNLWPNRLIGDAQLPDEVSWSGTAIKEWPAWLQQGQPRPKTDRIAFTTWRFWSKDSPLLPSGLLGPVTLYAVQEIRLDKR